MISIRRLLIREFLILGTLTLVLLLGARGLAELWTIRRQATTQAEGGFKLLEDGINNHTRGAEDLGRTLTLMWRRGEIGPGRPGTELILESLLRQSAAQNLILAGTQGEVASAHLLEGAYRTRSRVATEHGPRLLEKAWDENGQIIHSETLATDVPDYTLRPWYRQAMQEGGPAWSEPYLFITPKVVGVTYCLKAVDPEGRLLGAVGVDLRLDELNLLTQRYKPTPHAMSFVTAPDGKILTQAERQAASQEMDGFTGDPLTTKALGTPSAERGWPLVRAGGRFWLVHREKLDAPGWTLLVAIPLHDLISGPFRITLVALVIGFLTILGIALRLAVVSRRITHPLVELAKSGEGLLDGRPVSLPATDIRELAQANAALEAASSSLQEQRRLEEELQRIQRLELLGTMAAGLAHDMNNHLGAIQGQLELASLKSPEGSAQAPFLARAMASCERMARLLQDLVSFGKPRHLAMEKVDLNALVQQTGRLLEHSRGKLMQVELDLDPSRPMAMGDRIQLEQVMLNLGFNAKDATPEGGRLGLMTGHKGREAYFEVSDTGTGMTPEVKEHLFTPFFTTKGEKQGTGLGLAMVASIVKAHGGRITMESEPGHGTIFTIWLPLAEEGPAP